MSTNSVVPVQKANIENAVVSPMGISLNGTAEDVVRRLRDIAAQLADDRKSDKPLAQPLADAYAEIRMLGSDLGLALSDLAPETSSSRKVHHSILGLARPSTPRSVRVER
jgi:hypothetical protein